MRTIKLSELKKRETKALEVGDVFKHHDEYYLVVRINTSPSKDFRYGVIDLETMSLLRGRSESIDEIVNYFDGYRIIGKVEW